MKTQQSLSDLAYQTTKLLKAKLSHIQEALAYGFGHSSLAAMKASHGGLSVKEIPVIVDNLCAQRFTKRLQELSDGSAKRHPLTFPRSGSGWTSMVP